MSRPPGGCHLSSAIDELVAQVAHFQIGEDAPLGLKVALSYVQRRNLDTRGHPHVGIRDAIVDDTLETVHIGAHGNPYANDRRAAHRNSLGLENHHRVEELRVACDIRDVALYAGDGPFWNAYDLPVVPHSKEYVTAHVVGERAHSLECVFFRLSSASLELYCGRLSTYDRVQQRLRFHVGPPSLQVNPVVSATV